ncbi:hypothetical protein AVEN_192719-1 [Araneus ventricosus]|uniref:Uncharacterized protein n=1 Tax=Araneus ventricosus TaxID=182803 RepID=A0A4Y2JRH0_ARAVE|nr:hypothetical protein AVEN_192719-1 [Araneus ventricosus]
MWTNKRSSLSFQYLLALRVSCVNRCRSLGSLQDTPPHTKANSRIQFVVSISMSIEVPRGNRCRSLHSLQDTPPHIRANTRIQFLVSISFSIESSVWQQIPVCALNLKVLVQEHYSCILVGTVDIKLS